jgi:hypothetical protein
MATSRSTKKKDNTEIVKREPAAVTKRSESDPSLPVALTGGGVQTTMMILKDNLGAAGQLAVSDLTKIVIPGGGSTVWQMPNPVGGKPANLEEITCVIVAFKDQKAFWKESIDDSGGGTPPDCRSLDMIHGIGDPGGFCNGGTDAQPEPCPFNEFKSANEGEGEGKACKDLRFLFILEGKSRIPKLLIVPPTSLKGMRRYFLDLAGQEIPFYGVITSLTLVQDKNKKGIKYSRVEASAVADLSEQELAIAKQFKEMIDPMIGNMVSQLQGKDIKQSD